MSFDADTAYGAQGLVRCCRKLHCLVPELASAGHCACKSEWLLGTGRRSQRARRQWNSTHTVPVFYLSELTAGVAISLSGSAFSGFTQNRDCDYRSNDSHLRSFWHLLYLVGAEGVGVNGAAQRGRKMTGPATNWTTFAEWHKNILILRIILQLYGSTQ